MKKRTIPFSAMGGVHGADDVAAAMQVIEGACGVEGNFFPLPEENDRE